MLNSEFNLIKVADKKRQNSVQIITLSFSFVSRFIREQSGMDVSQIGARPQTGELYAYILIFIASIDGFTPNKRSSIVTQFVYSMWERGSACHASYTRLAGVAL